jgi:biotin carboxyl carrier protein
MADISTIALLDVRVAALLRIQAAVLSRQRLLEAATALANELSRELHLDRVCVGIVKCNSVAVVATSHRAETLERTEQLRGVTEAMEEAIEQAVTVTFPQVGSRHLIALAHAELSRQRGSQLCTVPLLVSEEVFGALLLERLAPKSFTDEDVAALENVASFAGPILKLLLENERPWHEHLYSRMRSWRARLVGPGNWGGKSGAVAILAASISMFFFPIQYWVGAQARVEGAVQRVLAAPVDGFVGQVAVRPGDTVRSEEILVELAEQDLQLERRKWESELAQHENAQNVSLARAERPQFVINKAKADAARAQLALITTQLARAQVRAPFDGVVIKGDLTQSLGAPVQRGEPLLTIAPARQFRLIVEVDERDIVHVQPGAKGSLALAALPQSLAGFRVLRITPVATVRDGRNFFEVEGSLEQLPPAVQPGLQGIAKIYAGQRSLAWILTHRAIDWVRLTIWRL